MNAPSAHECIVVGAGPSGLGTAASLIEEGVEVLVLEQGARLAAKWATRYDRLHLNTSSWFSYLPGQRFPREGGRWLNRDDLLRYYDDYAESRRIPIRTEVAVERVAREGGGWRLETPERPYTAETVVVATGKQDRPWVPDWPGRSGFQDTLIHSSEYRNAEPYRGLPALVVGSGNSGMDIALDLAEASDAPVWLSAQRPPHIMRREVLGLPHDLLGVMSKAAPRRIVDINARLLRRLLLGNLEEFGLPIPEDGVVSRLEGEGRVPAIDSGAFVAAVRAKRIEIVAGVERLEDRRVVLADGKRLEPALIVAATGYRPGLESLVGHLGLLGDDGLPFVNGSQTHSDLPGLYFVGFVDLRSGHLRELRLQAKAVARAFRPRIRRRFRAPISSGRAAHTPIQPSDKRRETCHADSDHGTQNRVERCARPQLR